MLGTNFPISEYYRDHIIDAYTLSRAGPWWTALLVIDDPRSGKPFIGLYRWQKSGGQWKTRYRFLIRKTSDLQTIADCLKNFAHHLPQE